MGERGENRSNAAGKDVRSRHGTGAAPWRPLSRPPPAAAAGAVPPHPVRSGASGAASVLPPSAPASRSIPACRRTSPRALPRARQLAPSPHQTHPGPNAFPPSLLNPRLPNPSQILPRAPSFSPGHAAALAARSAPTFWVLLGLLLLLVVLHDSHFLRRARGKRKKPRAETSPAAPSQVRAALRSATRPPW